MIERGIPASGMPAWGKRMDDQHLRGIVALPQQFKTMTAAKYSPLVAAGPGHSPSGGETDASSGVP